MLFESFNTYITPGCSRNRMCEHSAHTQKHHSKNAYFSGATYNSLHWDRTVSLFDQDVWQQEYSLSVNNIQSNQPKLDWLAFLAKCMCTYKDCDCCLRGRMRAVLNSYCISKHWDWQDSLIVIVEHLLQLFAHRMDAGDAHCWARTR